MSSKFTKEVKRDHQQSRDAHRTVNEGAKARDTVDKIYDHQAHFERDSAEIDGLFKVFKRHPEGSPKYEAAMERLDYLMGWRRQLYLQTVVALKYFLLSILREVGALLMLNLRVLFSILVNLVFFGFVIALLFAWAHS